MNYGKNEVEKTLRKTNSRSQKITSHLVLLLTKIILILVLFATVLGISFGYGIFKGVIDAAPEIDVASIEPSGYATMVYDSKGNLTETLVKSGANRLEASYEELPQCLIDAFVAIEDSRFWSHKGVDVRSMVRAAVGIITGDSSAGGGSTLTQQLIKNNIFEGGNEDTFGEKLERKIQEQYLAIQLEKIMDKKIILKNYLNTINLGNNTLGVKSAAKRYFGKDVSDLTLSEATVIAGITQNPTKYNPLSEKGQKNNEEKRRVILQYMYEQGKISKEDQEEALAMSDTVVVMDKGKIQQIGTPEDIYNEPKNAFVADFIGDSNIVDGVMHRDFLVSFSGVEFPCVDRGFAREESVQVVVRPEDIEVVSPVEGQLVGVVNDVIFKGVHFEMHVECEGREWLIHSTRACTPGETIGMRIGPNEIHIMSRSEG